MIAFDFTYQGKRPSAAQIVKKWKDAGSPKSFSVEYGETYAEFTLVPGYPKPRWDDSGNGCEGVKREQVVKALDVYHECQKAKFSDLWR